MIDTAFHIINLINQTSNQREINKIFVSRKLLLQFCKEGNTYFIRFELCIVCANSRHLNYATIWRHCLNLNVFFK